MLKSSNSHTCLLQFCVAQPLKNAQSLVWTEHPCTASNKHCTGFDFNHFTHFVLMWNMLTLPSSLLSIYNVSLKTELKYFLLCKSSISFWKHFYSTDILCTPKFAFYALSFFFFAFVVHKIELSGIYALYSILSDNKKIRLRNYLKIILMIILCICSFIYFSSNYCVPSTWNAIVRYQRSKVNMVHVFQKEFRA